MSFRPTPLVLTLIFACGAPADPTSDTTGTVDQPGTTTDCIPSAELCDGIDNDCDGTIDNDPDDATSFFADIDEDGFGNPNDGVLACEAPEGFVTDDRDCDDANANVNPNGVELCDGVDNDCDAATSEAGSATFFGEAGVEDRTDALTGTEATPVVATLTEPGTLNICEGTWFARLEVQADVDVVGPNGSAVTVMDGGDQGTVVDYASGVDASIRGFTLQNGNGGETCGGALCLANAVLDGSDLVMIGNVARLGGAIRVAQSTVTLADVDLSDNIASEDGGAIRARNSTITILDGAMRRNTADRAGALEARDTDITIERVDIEDNTGTTAAGAFEIDSGTLILRDSTVVRSVATNEGGAMRVSNDVDVQLVNTVLEGNTSRLGPAIMFRGNENGVITCQGAAGETAGIFGNVATSTDTAAIHLTGGTFVADNCDLVNPATQEDNTPTDIRLGTQQVETLGEDVTITCDRNGCAP